MKFAPAEPILVETECAAFSLRLDNESGPQPFYWAFRLSTATKDQPNGEIIGPFVSRETFDDAAAIDSFSPKPEYARCL